MPIWNDIRKQSAGSEIPKEDFVLVYPGKTGNKQIGEGVYRDIGYTVWTCGTFPFVEINMPSQISVFAGYERVLVTDDDGNEYEMDRSTDKAGSVYTFYFERKEDYIKFDHPGRKYTVDDLKQMCEMFIDILLKYESKITDHME